ncbi:MAG: hypothetical protein PVH05_15245 [Burkholderiales bacterium]
MKRTPDSRRRRRFLGRCVAASLSLPVVAAAVERPKPKDPFRKRSREEVHYQAEPYLGRSCAQCVLYQGHGVCVILEGAVSPNGYCDQWVPNTAG